MKKTVLIIIMLIAAVAASSQEVVYYRDAGYMEYPMDSMYRYYGNTVTRQKNAWTIQPKKNPITFGRVYTVDTPTVIYGIAMTLWGQDTAKRDLSVTLYSYNSITGTVTPRREVRWFDSMPFRYVYFDASDCNKTEYYIDTVSAYEFYFDEPAVVTDTFLVCYQTLGVDGLQHPNYPGYDIDSTGYAYVARFQITCTRNFPRPPWCHVIDSIPYFDDHGLEWAGIVPIIEQPPQQPCNPDTLTCNPVPDFGVQPLLSGEEVQFTWYALPSHRHFQISVGPYDTPPDGNPIYDADNQPFAITDNWDTTILYTACIRAQCSRYCHPDSTLVWSDWSAPVFFYTGRTMPDTTHHRNPEGIAAPDGRSPIFTLTPNPAHNSVTVTLNPQFSIPNSQFSISLTDAAGRELLTLPVTSQKFSIPLAKYPSGTYFLTLRTPSARSTQRLVIE